MSLNLCVAALLTGTGLAAAMGFEVQYKPNELIQERTDKSVFTKDRPREVCLMRHYLIFLQMMKKKS